MLNFITDLERQARIKYLNDLPLEALAQLDLENHALPKFERAVRLLDEARQAGDLAQTTRGQRRLGWAILDVGRCLLMGAAGAGPASSSLLPPGKTRQPDDELPYHLLPRRYHFTGDLNPGRQERKNGVVARGYDQTWFSGKLEPRYLAEKFLTEVWVPEYFREYVRSYLVDKARERSLDIQRRLWRVGSHEENWTEAKALKYLIKSDSLICDPHTTYDNLPIHAYRQNGTIRWHCPYDSDFVGTGYGYDPIEMGWLSAIQRRFSELITEFEAVKA